MIPGDLRNNGTQAPKYTDATQQTQGQGAEKGIPTAEKEIAPTPSRRSMSTEPGNGKAIDVKLYEKLCSIGMGLVDKAYTSAPGIWLDKARNTMLEHLAKGLESISKKMFGSDEALTTLGKLDRGVERLASRMFPSGVRKRPEDELNEVVGIFRVPLKGSEGVTSKTYTPREMINLLPESEQPKARQLFDELADAVEDRIIAQKELKSARESFFTNTQEKQTREEALKTAQAKEKDMADKFCALFTSAPS